MFPFPFLVLIICFTSHFVWCFYPFYQFLPCSPTPPPTQRSFGVAFFIVQNCCFMDFSFYLFSYKFCDFQYIQLCNHHNLIKHFYYPQRNPYTLAVISQFCCPTQSPSQARAIANPFSASMVCLLWPFHINGIIICGLLQQASFSQQVFKVHPCCSTFHYS